MAETLAGGIFIWLEVTGRGNRCPAGCGRPGPQTRCRRRVDSCVWTMPDPVIRDWRRFCGRGELEKLCTDCTSLSGPSVLYVCTARVPVVLGHPGAVCTSKDITVYLCIVGGQGVLSKISDPMQQEC